MFFYRFIPAIVWFIISLVLLCLPGSSIPKLPSWLAGIQPDKWVHITMFFILCFLFARPLKNSALKKDSRKKWFVLITVCGIVFGTIMEFVQQRWIPNRSFELLDIVADSTGCLLALLYSVRNFMQERV